MIKKLTITISPAQIRVREDFKAAMDKNNTIDQDDQSFITDAIAGYAEYPVISDRVTDQKRKEFKMSVDEITATMLRKTKLNRVAIANMAIAISLHEELFIGNDQELAHQLITIKETVDLDRRRNSPYNKMNRVERLRFVYDTVAPFVLKVCTAFIENN